MNTFYANWKHVGFSIFSTPLLFLCLVARGCFGDLEGTMKPFPYHTELPQRKGLDIVAECVRLVQDLLYSVKVRYKLKLKENC